MALEVRMVVIICRGTMHDWCFWVPCNVMILDLGASYMDVFSLLKLLGCTFMIWAVFGNVLPCNSLLTWHINMPYSYAPLPIFLISFEIPTVLGYIMVKTNSVNSHWGVELGLELFKTPFSANCYCVACLTVPRITPVSRIIFTWPEPELTLCEKPFPLG